MREGHPQQQFKRAGGAAVQKVRRQKDTRTSFLGNTAAPSPSQGKKRMYPSQVGAFVSLESYVASLCGPDCHRTAVLSEIMFTWGAISAPFAPLFARKHSHTHVQRSQSDVEGTRAIQEGCGASARHKCSGYLVPGVAFNIRDPRVAFNIRDPRVSYTGSPRDPVFLNTKRIS